MGEEDFEELYLQACVDLEEYRETNDELVNEIEEELKATQNELENVNIKLEQVRLWSRSLAEEGGGGEDK